jgi:hypothetical protein
VIQEGHKFQASLDDVARSYLNKQQKQTNKTKQNRLADPENDVWVDFTIVLFQ